MFRGLWGRLETLWNLDKDRVKEDSFFRREREKKQEIQKKLIIEWEPMGRDVSG